MNEEEAFSEKPQGDKIAKVLSRAGVASRREAEKLIREGRVAINGETITEPATRIIAAAVKITVDGEAVVLQESIRLWKYHKPKGVMVTRFDPEGRETIFDALPEEIGMVQAVGRLDYTSEGLLLLTTHGGLKRYLELPKTGWLRRYRVRVHGFVKEDVLQKLAEGITVEGVQYDAVHATIERQQGTNAWLVVSLREGKNREIRRIFEHLGYPVTRLIRVSYGAFHLGGLPAGNIEEVHTKTLKEQLGLKVWEEVLAS